MKNKENKLLSVAIEIGTSDSGYAFLFKGDDIRRISTIQIIGSENKMSTKWPTCLLFNPDGTFHSFGYEAENKYSDLAAYDEHRTWYYFQRFKPIIQSKEIESIVMKPPLLIEEIQRDMEIQDDKGLTMPARKVFGYAIRFLKMHLLSTLKTRGTGVEEKDIHWVLTVPAIRNRNDAAKQFMREAAVEYAEIDSGALTIASEPEAISLYCQLLPNDTFPSQGKLTAAKYMILDLGSDAANITVHEKQADGSLRELHEPTGGAWGGTKVNEAFHQMLIKIVGAKTLKQFCDSHKADHVDLLRELETKKRTINPDLGGEITVKIPVSLISMYEKENRETIADALKETPFKDKMIWAADKVRIEANYFKALFKDCTDGVTQCVRQLLQKPEVKGVDTFVMVGGFSESPVMQAAIKDAFPNAKIIIPADAGLVVLKGAVVFGREPMKISSRIAKYTYGISISPPFVASVHPHEKKMTIGEKQRCKDVFKKYIQKGESIRIGELRSEKHARLKANQKEMILKIYSSAARDPQFVTDPGYEYIGRLVVKLPEEQYFKVNVDMMFGQTGLLVEAEEETSRRKFTSYFDFL